jgi:hypothetical protein
MGQGMDEPVDNDISIIIATMFAHLDYLAGFIPCYFILLGEQSIACLLKHICRKKISETPYTLLPRRMRPNKRHR